MTQVPRPSKYSTCPLCGLDATVQPSQRFFGDNVDCNRCGSFRLEDGVPQGFEQQRHLIAAAIRRLQRSQGSSIRRVSVTPESVPNLLAGIGSEGGLLNRLDDTLEFVSAQQTRSDEFVEYRDKVAVDYPLVLGRDGNEFSHFLQTLAAQGLLEEPKGQSAERRTSFRLTPTGWQVLRELAKTRRRSNQAFVAMWFDDQMQGAWQNGIKAALTDLGYDAKRIDESHGSDKIDDRIIAEIRRSELVVADFTGHRGGVYFEVGLAVGLGIPIVCTCRRDEVNAAHFDTRQYQHVLWETPQELRGLLVNHIAARIPGRQLP